MTQNAMGWTLALGGIGAVLGAIGVQIVSLPSWDAALTPAFVGTALVQVGGVLAAYFGGRALPQTGKP